MLYETGAVLLVYEDQPVRGAYQREGNRITFTFPEWQPDTGAIGTLTQGGDLLEVRYSDYLLQVDFENAIYRWVGQVLFSL